MATNGLVALGPQRNAGRVRRGDRDVKFRLRRCRWLQPDDVAVVQEAYGLFRPGAAGERIDPALLERALWAGLA